MNIPSEETIRKRLRIDDWADDPAARTTEIRKVLERARDKAGRHSLSLKEADYFMVEIDKLCEMHGVETVTTKAFRNGDVVCLYCNSGDTYSPTILFDVRVSRFRVTTLGDWLETEERAGRKYE